MSTPIDPEAVRRYFDRDRLARLLGIEVIEVAPGRARARLTLRPELHNGVGIAHGGTIFTLADVAFAAAANSHGRVAVGIGASISFLTAVSEGTLTAEAVEVSCGHKLATCTIQVKDEAGTIIAIMQGTVYRKKEELELS